MTVAVFNEGETVLHLEEGVLGTIDIVREDLDALTDRPVGEIVYEVLWADGEYSTHLESELVGLEE